MDQEQAEQRLIDSPFHKLTGQKPIRTSNANPQASDSDSTKGSGVDTIPADFEEFLP